MIQRLTLLLAGLVALLPLVPERALAQQVGVGLQAGSLGPGATVVASVTPRINVRGAAHFFSYAHREVFSDEQVELQVDAEARLASGALLVDVYPLRRFLHLSAGLVLNRNEVSAVMAPISSYTINDKEFQPEKIGSLKATVGHKTSVHPYAGIGIGNALRGSRLGLSLDLGVLYTDSPRIDMEGSGMIAPTAEQDTELEADLEGIRLYPHVALGLTFRIR